MSTEGDERNTSTPATGEDGLPAKERGQEDAPTLSGAVISRLSWAQRAVSPWVRRALGSGRASPPGARDAAGRRASTALSYEATSRFLRRAQRVVEGRSWQPELGSLDPQSVARFSEEVTARYPELARHQVTWLPEEEADHDAEFPLAGQDQPATGRPARAARLPAAPQAPSAIGTGMTRRQASGAQPGSSPSTVQREPTRRLPPARPSKPPPTGRLFSRVEELPPASQEAVPEAGRDEPAMPPEAPDRAAQEVARASEQGWRAVDAELPSVQTAPGPETALRHAIQRQAGRVSPTANGDAGTRAPRQPDVSRPASPALPSRASTGQPAEERPRSPASPVARPPDIPPTAERATGRQEAPQTAEAPTEDQAIDGTASSLAALPPGLDRAVERDHPGHEEGAEAAVVRRPAQAQPALQEHDMPAAQRKAERASPGRSRASSQAESSSPDQPRAAQQRDMLAAQPSPAQEETAASPAVPGGEAAIEPLADEEGRAAASPTAGRAQREALPSGGATGPAASRETLDRSLPLPRRVGGEQEQGTRDRTSTSPRAEGTALQREAPRPAQASSATDEGGSSLQPRGPEQRQGQAGSQPESRSSIDAIQRSPDQGERTAPQAGAVVGAGAASAPEPSSEGGAMSQLAEQVVQARPAGQSPSSAEAGERAPAAGRGPTPPHDAAAMLAGVTEEGAGDQLPLATGRRESTRQAAVPGEPGMEGPTESEPEAPASAEGGSVAQRQAGPAAPPRRDVPQRLGRLPLGERGPAESGASAPAVPSRGDQEGTAVTAEKAVTPVEGTAGVGQEPQAPEQGQPRDSRADTRPSTALARELPVSRTVQRTSEPSTARAGTGPALETAGEGEKEGVPGEGGEPEARAAPLQRQAAGRQGPLADASRAGAADVDGVGPAPQREHPLRQPSDAEPGAGDEREGGPLAASFVPPRPVVQTKSLADTAILPQVRRAPMPRARLATESRGESLPLPAQHPQLLAGSEETAGSAVARAPVGPAVALHPPVQPSTEATVQRQPLAAPIVSGPDVEETADVQRALAEPQVKQPVQDQEPDLDRLAREVYPLVKRLLAVERERRASRWG